MTDTRDITGKNRKFTGTVGIKLPVGSDSDRVDEQGQIRFNSTTNLAEYYDGADWKAIDAPPVISNFTLDGGNTTTSAKIDNTAGGDATIVIFGSIFDTTGGQVTFEPESGGTTVTVQSITRTSANQFTVTVTRSDFIEANDPYALVVTNGSGLSATLSGALDVNAAPSFDTAAGSLGTVYQNAPVSGTALDASATDVDGDTITYSISAGSLPSGLSINSSTGYITGTPSGSTGDSTFTVQAATSHGNSTRQFSITVEALPSGGSISTFGDYRIHAFNSPGTFTNTVSGLTADVLLVAGGGGGGSGQTPCTNNHHCGGGGGAGGLVYKTNQTVTTGNKSIVVGGGGTGARAQTDRVGEKGSNSTALGFTALGGGGGETRNSIASCGLNNDTLDGGSGGGRSNTDGRAGDATQPGSADGGFGNEGGTGTNDTGQPAGGGGGAGAAGGSGVDGDGGAGRDYSGQFGTSHGESGWFAAGGGGGAATSQSDGEGGQGGGGDGVDGDDPGGDGQANTGSGGGGAGGETPGGGNSEGGNGGSGIVLIRYNTTTLV